MPHCRSEVVSSGSLGRLRISAACLVLLALGISQGRITPLVAQTQRPQAPQPSQPASKPAANISSQPASDEDVDDGHPLREPLKRAYASRAALYEVRDYAASFIKSERIGNRLVKQSMFIKVRENPFSVYLKFQGQEAGREVIYPSPGNRNNLLVHAEGIKAIAGTVSLPLTSPEITSENRYPISSIGISNMLAGIIAQWKEETRFGEVDVKLFPDAKLNGMSCPMIQTSHPQPRRQFRFHKTQIFFDKQTNLPVRVAQYGWPRVPGEQPPVIEEYMYSNVKTNIGLTDQDFNPRNPQYRF